MLQGDLATPPPAAVPGEAPATGAVAPVTGGGRGALVALAMALAGTAVTLRTMFASGLALVPGNLKDARLEAFFLEHSWLWLAGDPLHAEAWALPMFWPAGGNALAMSDAMLSFGPLYWPWRAVGLPADTSYQLWLAAVLLASALAVHGLLRLAGATPWSAGLGAWLATFAASRLHQVSHPQLLPLFFLAAALAGGLGWARAATPRGRRLALAGAAGALVAQLYGGFYLGLLGLLALAALLAIALLVPGLRPELLRRLRADAVVLAAVAALAGVTLVPWVAHYRAAHQMVGGRGWAEVAPLLPTPATWLYMTPRAPAYRDLGRLEPFAPLVSRFEHAVGLGFFTTALVLLAAAAARRRRAVQVAGGAMLLLVVLTTRWPDGVEPWRLVVAAMPPLAAFRAVARVGLLLPLAAAAVLAGWRDGARPGWPRRLATVAMALALAEQVCVVEHHDKVAQRRWAAAIASQVPTGADAFVVTRSGRKPEDTLIHIDALWATTAAGKPTLNGFSGITPPDWALEATRVASAEQERVHRAAVAAWLARHGASGARVARVHLPPSYRAEPSTVDLRARPHRRRAGSGPRGPRRRQPAPDRRPP
jgi:hypothetical protein